MRALLSLYLFALVACGDDSGSPGSLKGTVKDKNGAPVGDAVVKAGDRSVKASYSGEYVLEGLPGGEVSISVSADWFEDKQATGKVPGELNVTLDERALRIDEADRALAESTMKGLDWTTAELYVAVLLAPTRRYLDNGIYHRNPALFRDTSKTASVTPSPQPTIDAGGAQGFNFPLTPGGTEQALVVSTIVDSFDKTGLAAGQASDFLLWTPMVNWLSDAKRKLDTATLGKVRAVGTAVAGQAWGSSALKPQQIQDVYLSNGEMWVKIVFEPFVQLGAGIADDDSDGRKEVFAKVDPKNVPAPLIELLQSQYVSPRLGTLQLKAELSDALNELYTSTNLQILKTIGQPYDAPGGTFKYPFVVHEQSGQARKVKGVLLVGP